MARGGRVAGLGRGSRGRVPARKGHRPARGHARRARPRLVRLTWEPGPKSFPSISPDGASFVYQAGRPGEADIFLRRIGGENPVNLTKDFPGDDLSPAFSPDGQSIAFGSDREGGGIFLMGRRASRPGG